MAIVAVAHLVGLAIRDGAMLGASGLVLTLTLASASISFILSAAAASVSAVAASATTTTTRPRYGCHLGLVLLTEGGQGFV